ncbi:hypothetical protein B7463_g9977, partial [Scytalidium lignicola]
MKTPSPISLHQSQRWEYIEPLYPATPDTESYVFVSDEYQSGVLYPVTTELSVTGTEFNLVETFEANLHISNSEPVTGSNERYLQPEAPVHHAPQSTGIETYSSFKPQGSINPTMQYGTAPTQLYETVSVNHVPENTFPNTSFHGLSTSVTPTKDLQYNQIPREYLNHSTTDVNPSWPVNYAQDMDPYMLSAPQEGNNNSSPQEPKSGYSYDAWTKKSYNGDLFGMGAQFEK